MNKKELLSLANIGKTEINGFPLEIKVFPSSADGTDWIEIYVEPLSPLHQPLLLGQTWVEFVTDEDCEQLTEALVEYKRKADNFCQQAKTVVKATLNSDDSYSFIDVPDKIKEKYKDYTRFLKERHFIKFIGSDKEYWYAPDVFTLELNGIQYTPHWSYWLDCAYYEVDEQIKQIAERSTQ